MAVFHSGHGAPDPARGTSYLVPYDGDPAFLGKTAYPLTRLYDALRRVKARRAVVLLDACFSGAGRRSALAAGARPLVTQARPAAIPADVAKVEAQARKLTGNEQTPQLQASEAARRGSL